MRSKKWCFLLIGASLLAQLPAAAARVERGTLVFDNVPPAPAALTASLDNYLNARQATPLGWSPGGQLLIATRFGDADQLHVLDKAGGARRQVTFYKEPVNEAVFSPDANQAGFVFLKDVGGDENSQLYFQRVGRDHGATADRRQITERRSALVECRPVGGLLQQSAQRPRFGHLHRRAGCGHAAEARLHRRCAGLDRARLVAG